MTLRIICFIILSAAMCLIEPTTGKHVGKYHHDDNFCDGKPNGNYRDPDTCYGYIACSNGIPYKMPCQTGLMYNEEKDQCDYPQNVDCPTKSFTCRGKPNGDYKDPNNCYGFISCSNGIPYYMKCPAGLRFNAALDQCDWPQNVKC